MLEGTKSDFSWRTISGMNSNTEGFDILENR